VPTRGAASTSAALLGVSLRPTDPARCGSASLAAGSALTAGGWAADADVGRALVLETWIAFAALAALAGCAAALAVAPDALLLGGFWVTAAGLAVGLPTGFAYHLALRRSLRSAGRLPARWWLHPTALHGALPDADRARVLAWCGVGAAGFAVSLLGCSLVALGAWRAG
jgi:hypothetical protein